MFNLGVMRLFSAYVCLLSSLLTIHALYDSNNDVIELTPSNYDQYLSEPGVLLVKFYLPNCVHCRNLVPEWNKLASATKGLIKVAAVNAQDHPSISSRYQITGYPTIKVFLADKSKPISYNGPRDASSILSEVLRSVKTHVTSKIGGGKSTNQDGSGPAVVSLTDDNFDSKVLNNDLPWMVGFFANWCGHCKNLKPHWKKAAEQLRGKVNFGEVEAPDNRIKTSEYNVEAFPTIRFFPAKSSSSGDAVDYEGSRDEDGLVAWLSSRLEASVPDPELVEATDAAAFDGACKDHSLCVISVLPALYDCDAACRNAYLQLVRDESMLFKKQNWGWLWTSAFEQEKMENELNLGGSGYPAMVALHLGKMKRVTLLGPFNKNGVHNFLLTLSVGGGKLAQADLKAHPTFVKSEPWDGQDAPPIEEDEEDVDFDTKSEL